MPGRRPLFGGTVWSARRFERQIDYLHARYVLTPRLSELEQDGVVFASLVRHKRAFARVLARTVARGDYASAPARIKHILVDDKQRRVFSLGMTDLILHGVIADLIQESATPAFSPCLYSYRQGRSWWTAVGDFARYVQRHRRDRPDPR